MSRIFSCATLLWLVSIAAYAQPQTHVIKLNADGSFAPQITYIRSGDTVRWEQLTRTDSIIPAASQPYPAICSARNPYNPSDPNDFTGPVPFAPSGVFTLSPLDTGYTEATSTCPAGSAALLRGDNGKVLCYGKGDYEATLPSTWQSDQITGVFIRLLWSDINPQPGVYDFSILQREIEQAVKYGKLYSIGIKAGNQGTPDWIFSNGVPRLHFQDAGDGDSTTCGSRMDLGNPTRTSYRQLYNAMLTEVAKFIKSRADWYRALAYVKISGANLFSHENRLPNGCVTIGQMRCPCNPQIFSADGYRPSGLYSFYDEQTKLLHDLFPGKPMSYALIQDGFPRISESGDYQNYDGNSSGSTALPGAFEQTQTAMDRGQQQWGLNFVVQHNGLQAKGTGCPFDGQHPKPDRALDAFVGPPGSKCPNRWAVREGAQGQLTGFQTTNLADISEPADLDLTFQNEWDNSDGMFIEIYEEIFWLVQNTAKGILPRSSKTIAGWADDFHKRRNDPTFPNYIAAGNPFPSTFSHTFKNTANGATQYLYFIHGSKCGAGKQEWGAIVIDGQLPAIQTGGVVSASAFGQFSSVAPGSWIEIYGTGLAAGVRQWATSDFNGVNAPTGLDGTSVKIGGQSAFVSFISPGQINAQVPSNVPTGAQLVLVTTPLGTSIPSSVAVNAVQPGLDAPSVFNIGGRQYVVALFPDGSYVLPPGVIPGLASRRAHPGDTITLYGIGFGPVTPNIPAGQTVQQNNALSMPLQVSFGGTRATVTYAGLAPDAVGLYQINLTVPNVAASDAVPLTFTLGGVTGTQTLYVPVL